MACAGMSLRSVMPAPLYSPGTSQPDSTRLDKLTLLPIRDISSPLIRIDCKAGSLCSLGASLQASMQLSAQPLCLLAEQRYCWEYCKENGAAGRKYAWNEAGLHPEACESLYMRTNDIAERVLQSASSYHGDSGEDRAGNQVQCKLWGWHGFFPAYELIVTYQQPGRPSWRMMWRSSCRGPT